jgi:hypothetical protein
MIGQYKRTLTCKLINDRNQTELKLKASNLGVGDTLGGETVEAINITYDRLINTHSNLNTLNFPYYAFRANMMWWVDATIGMESRWLKKASTGKQGNTAYGWGQITQDTTITACNRYVNLVDKWNKTSFYRRWSPSNENNIMLIGFLEVAKEEDVHPEDLIAGVAISGGAVHKLMQSASVWYNKGATPAEKLMTWKELIKNDWKQLTRTNKAFSAGAKGTTGWRFWRAFMWGKAGSKFEGQFKSGPTPLFRRLGSALRFMLGKLTAVLLLLESRSLNTGEPGLDEWMTLQELNKEIRYVPAFISKIIANPATDFASHKKIIDSLSYDEIGALIIANAEGASGTDANGWIHMTSDDIDILRDGAKGLYEYGHHSKFSSTTPDLAQILSNMDIFFDCPQPTAHSLKAGLI